MLNYLKAGMAMLLLVLTLGVIFEAMIWGLLSTLHANNTIILSGEAVGLIGLLVLGVPLFKLILNNERAYAREADLGSEPNQHIDR